MPVRLIDATFRDGQESLFASRIPSEEFDSLLREVDGIGFAAIDGFGGTSFESTLRLGRDPWEWLRHLNEAVSTTPILALLRGQHLVGHRSLADDTVELFLEVAARNGVRVFRLLDPLNDVRNLEVPAQVARRVGGRVQAALCYTISPIHDLGRWCSLARELAALGIDELVIDDDAGLLTPDAARKLVRALSDTVGLPVYVHARCTGGIAATTYIAAVEAGVSGMDTAFSAFAWGTSLPAVESMVAVLTDEGHDPGLDFERLVAVGTHLEEIRQRHREQLLPGADRVDPEVVGYRLPSPMLHDLRGHLNRHNAQGRLIEALEEVPRIHEELGYPPLVPPIRQMIAAQAVFNTLVGERYMTVTQELKDYLQGLYGRPPGPVDVEVRRLVLGHDEPITVRAADLLEPQVEVARAELEQRDLPASDEDVLTYLLFPALATDLFQARTAPPSSASPPMEPPESEAVEAEPKEVVETKTSAAAEVQPPAPTPIGAEFEVEVEGEIFRVRVAGAGMLNVSAPTSVPAPPAPSQAPRDGAIKAPMQGLIVKIPVSVGDEVQLGDVVAVLEAMKMQNDIIATQPGKVLEIYVKEGDVVSPDQALVAIG
jgi:pyruvate carboxylase subunit B